MAEQNSTGYEIVRTKNLFYKQSH